MLLRSAVPSSGLARVLRLSIPSTRSFSHCSQRLEVSRGPVKPATSSYRPPAAVPQRNPDGLTIYPILFIIALGSGSFYLLVKRREGQSQGPTNPSPLSGPQRSHPLFRPGTGEGEALVIFVLGGPGAGKGTQCANLVRDYGFRHLSAGDLLRSEQDRPGSEFGAMIAKYIKEGQIVPMEVTIRLLENAMKDTIASGGKRSFLIDGFPRKMDQALAFEKQVVKSRFTLFFECPEETLRERLMERGRTSGRSDDNAESIAKRFRVFVETSMPVVEMFEREGRVVRVDATPGPDEVYAHVRRALKEREGLEPINGEHVGQS
ncbi:hypothetical protein M433DRAFT_57118 [Acidomyces richmondensis BFW]|nr:hypothetical protein M433DRAFT_57118 [Acidomyces richmondensis BFW]